MAAQDRQEDISTTRDWMTGSIFQGAIQNSPQYFKYINLGMVRSREVDYLRKINGGSPHNGLFGSLIRKDNFERPPHLFHLPRSRWGMGR